MCKLCVTFFNFSKVVCTTTPKQQGVQFPPKNLYFKANVSDVA